MRMHPDKMKMLVFMTWLVQSHLSLLDKGENEIPEGDGADEEYNRLYLCSKEYLKEAGDLKKYSNFYSIATRLNFHLEKVKREVFKKMGDSGVTLMMFIVGALRHCNIEKLRGFEELKTIDLDSIIARARQEQYLNQWNIQSLTRSFKYGYWEA